MNLLVLFIASYESFLPDALLVEFIELTGRLNYLPMFEVHEGPGSSVGVYHVHTTRSDHRRNAAELLKDTTALRALRFRARH